MKQIVLLAACFLLLQVSFSQSANDFYRKAETALTAKDYTAAALAFADGIRAEGDATGIFRYRSAAAAFALAENKDSAFYYLQLMTVSPKLTRVVVKNVENGYEFNNLQKDKRWTALLTKLQKKAESNGYVQEELIYGRKDGMALTMVQIKPKVKPNGKAIIFVISGGWISFYNGIEINTFWMTDILDRGYTIFAVMHGSGPRYAIPDNITDMKRAVRYVRYHAGKFNIDPNKIGITGSSAGGHLSLMIALSDDAVNTQAADPVDRVSARVQVAAVLFPPTDLLNWGGAGLNMVNAKELVKQRGSYGAIDFKVWNEKLRIYEEVSDTAQRTKIGKESSPVYHVSSDDPPVYIIHGDADATVPLQQSKEMINKLNAAGVKNKLVIKKGGRHTPDDMLPEYREFVNWFDEHLK